MLSRIADSLYWLNRYMERADGVLRTAFTHASLLLDKDVNSDLSWQHVLEIFTDYDKEEINLIKDDSHEVLLRIILDATNPNSVKSIVIKARENARGVQDHITKEVWEQVNSLYHNVNSSQLEDKLKGFQMIESLDGLLRESTLYTGFLDSTMPRGQGWHFMNLGKYIERCLISIETLNKFYEMIDYDMKSEKDILHWRPLLLSLSGYELHLKTYNTNDHNANALLQVLFNENFTRGILYSLIRIHRYVTQVLKLNHSDNQESLVKQFGRLYSRVEYTDFDTLNKEVLKEFLDDLKTELNEFSSKFAQSYFSYY